MAKCQFIRDSRSSSHPLLSMIATRLRRCRRTMFRRGGRAPRGLPIISFSSAI